MKVSYRRVQMWLMLFCILTAVVSVFVFVGSSRAEGEAVESGVELQDGMEMQYVAGIQPKEIENPTCLDNYESWPSSSREKQNAKWSTDFLVPITIGQGAQDIQQFMDINGDGLLDYLYVNNQYQIFGYEYHYGSYGSSYSHILIDGVETQDKKWRIKNSCVYLNNGAGWDVAYRCVVSTKHLRTETVGRDQHHYREPVFYGDCADVS